MKKINTENILDDIEDDIKNICHCQTSTGAFLSEYPLQNNTVTAEEPVLFVTGIILSIFYNASKILESPQQLTTAIQKCIKLFTSECSENKTWNYYPRAQRRFIFPDDADDTALISHALSLFGIIVPNKEIFTSLITNTGFTTWFKEDTPKDIDPLVNMHIALYIDKLHPQTIPLLQDYIYQKISSPWYKSYIVGLFFIARAINYAPHLFSTLIPLITTKVKEIIKQPLSLLNTILIHYISVTCDLHISKNINIDKYSRENYYFCNKYANNCYWKSNVLTQAIICETKIILYKKYLQKS